MSIGKGSKKTVLMTCQTLVLLMCAPVQCFATQKGATATAIVTKASNVGDHNVNGKKVRVVEKIMFRNITDSKGANKETIKMVINATIRRGARVCDTIIVPISLEYREGKNGGAIGTYSFLLVADNKKGRPQQIESLNPSAKLGAEYSWVAEGVAKSEKIASKAEQVVISENGEGNSHQVVEATIRLLIDGKGSGEIATELRKASDAKAKEGAKPQVSKKDKLRRVDRVLAIVAKQESPQPSAIPQESPQGSLQSTVAPIVQPPAEAST